MLNKIIIRVLLYLCIFSFNLHAQGVTSISIETNATLLPQGLLAEALDGYGLTNCTITSIANISSANPASMADYHTFSAAVSKRQIELVVDAPPWSVAVTFQ